MRCQQAATATEIKAAAPDAVAALGDTQYDSGAYSEYMGTGAFNDTWGAFKSKILPVPGNHEYNTTGAAGYYQYFGASAGDPAKGYYSYDLGAWHIIALNSACSGSACSSPTAGQVSPAQVTWLHSDLAAHPGVCTLAYWHHPLFSSGVFNGGSIASLGVKPLWDELYAAHADVVLNGHAHNYERFAPQNPSGQAVMTGGLREFVVGTGGEDHLTGSQQPNSAKLDTSDFGALFLTLHPGSYDWKFQPTGTGATFDQGTGGCNRDTTSTAVSSSPNPASPSQSITLTATVKDASQPTTVPTGAVNFKFDGADVGSAALDSSGRATVAVPAQAPGSHQFQASYFGSQTALASTSSQVAQRVTPAAPTGVSAKANDGSVSLSWTASAGATSYKVLRGTTSSGESSTPIATQAGTSYTDPGLTNGTTYYYKVLATSNVGDSPPSQEANATPRPPPPVAPASVSTSAGDRSVTVSWSASAGATRYEVLRGTSPGGESPTPVATQTGTSYTDPGLTNGTTYYYKIIATNGGGDSPRSAESSATPQPPPPAAPSGVSATAGDRSVTVSWSSSSGATSYKVLRGTTAGGESTTPLPTQSGTSYTDTGLTNGTTYYYKIIATNGGGDSASSAEVQATPQPPPPPPPSGVSASAGDHSVTVRWAASTGATSYKVLRGTSPGGESPVPVQTGPGMTYTDSGLTNGTRYYYKIIATNGGGDSAQSQEANATPQAPPAPPPAPPAPSPAPAPNPAPGPAAAPTDTKPPTITLSTPADGAHYVLGATVDAAYGCQDEQNGSGVASCTGTVVRGRAIDTGSLGTKAFTVTATDNAHNQASKTAHYTVDADPGPAEIKASVGAALQAAAHALSRLHLRALVRVSSFRFSFNASAPGTAVFTATARIKGKTITVASGHLTFTGPGKRTATQRISRAAVRALRGLRSASVFERIKFTPARGNPFVGRQRVTLRR